MSMAISVLSERGCCLAEAKNFVDAKLGGEKRKRRKAESGNGEARGQVGLSWPGGANSSFAFSPSFRPRFFASICVYPCPSVVSLLLNPSHHRLRFSAEE
jgi:hypothetical protein